MVWQVSTEFNQDCCLKTTWFIPNFLLSPSHCMFFQSCSFVIEMCILVPKSFILNLVLIQSKSKKVHSYFCFSDYANNPSWWPLLPKRHFCRAHSVVDMCQILGQSGSQGGVVGLLCFSIVFTFLAVNYSNTVRPVGTIFFVKHYHIISSYGTKFHVSSSFQLTANWPKA